MDISPASISNQGRNLIIDYGVKARRQMRGLATAEDTRRAFNKLAYYIAVLEQRNTDLEQERDSLEETLYAHQEN